LAPLTAILEMLRDAFPILESVTICGELVVPVPCWLKVILVPERLTSGEGGAPPPPPPPPPPPQATQIPTTNNAVATSKLAGRRRAATEMISIASANSPAMSQGHPEGIRKIGSAFARRARTAELAGPIVVKVTVAVTDEELLMVTSVGETLQLISSVSVKQVTSIVPMNPFTGQE